MAFNQTAVHAKEETPCLAKKEQAQESNVSKAIVIVRISVWNKWKQKIK